MHAAEGDLCPLTWPLTWGTSVVSSDLVAAVLHLGLDVRRQVCGGWESSLAEHGGGADPAAGGELLLTPISIEEQSPNHVRYT